MSRRLLTPLWSTKSHSRRFTVSIGHFWARSRQIRCPKASDSNRVHRLTAPNSTNKNVGFHPLRAIFRGASANATNKGHRATNAYNGHAQYRWPKLSTKAAKFIKMVSRGRRTASGANARLPYPGDTSFDSNIDYFDKFSQHLSRLSFDVLKAEKAFGIPTGDDTVQILSDDCVIGRGDDRCKLA